MRHEVRDRIGVVRLGVVEPRRQRAVASGGAARGTRARSAGCRPCWCRGRRRRGRRRVARRPARTASTKPSCARPTLREAVVAAVEARERTGRALRRRRRRPRRSTCRGRRSRSRSGRARCDARRSAASVGADAAAEATRHRVGGDAERLQGSDPATCGSRRFYRSGRRLDRSSRGARSAQQHVARRRAARRAGARSSCSTSTAKPMALEQRPPLATGRRCGRASADGRATRTRRGRPRRSERDARADRRRPAARRRPTAAGSPRSRRRGVPARRASRYCSTSSSVTTSQRSSIVMPSVRTSPRNDAARTAASRASRARCRAATGRRRDRCATFGGAGHAAGHSRARRRPSSASARRVEPRREQALAAAEVDQARRVGDRAGRAAASRTADRASSLPRANRQAKSPPTSRYRRRRGDDERLLPSGVVERRLHRRPSSHAAASVTGCQPIARRSASTTSGSASTITGAPCRSPRRMAVVQQQDVAGARGPCDEATRDRAAGRGVTVSKPRRVQLASASPCRSSAPCRNTLRRPAGARKKRGARRPCRRWRAAPRRSRDRRRAGRATRSRDDGDGCGSRCAWPRATISRASAGVTRHALADAEERGACVERRRAGRGRAA